MPDLDELFLSDTRLLSERALQQLLTDLPLSLGKSDASALLAFLHLTAGETLRISLDSNETGTLTLTMTGVDRGAGSGLDRT